MNGHNGSSLVSGTADSIWSLGSWICLLNEIDREARRRTSYEPRNLEFTVEALCRVTAAMAVSLALTEAGRAVEAGYRRRYLRRRIWVTDAVTL